MPSLHFRCADHSGEEAEYSAEHIVEVRSFGHMCQMRRKLQHEIPTGRLDAIDIRILAALQDDGSLTNVDLAKQVGLSPSPCLARVRALEEAGVILRKVTLLDPVKLGANVSVFIQVTLEKQTEAVLDSFEAAMAGFPEVMECYLMTG